MDDIAEVKKLLKEDKLIIGKDFTMKALRKGDLASVFLAKNCPKDARADIEHLASVGNIEVRILSVENSELGDVCKRPHFIAVMGIKK